MKMVETIRKMDGRNFILTHKIKKPLQIIMITIKIIKLINYVFKNVETQYELTVQFKWRNCCELKVSGITVFILHPAAAAGERGGYCV
jgi:hypothetical protein